MDTKDVKVLSLLVLVDYLPLYIFLKIVDGNSIVQIYKDVLLNIIIIAITTWINLAIIQKSLESDKTKRLETVRINTNHEIKSTIQLILFSIYNSTRLGFTTNDDEKIKNILYLINEDNDSPDAINIFNDLLMDLKENIISKSDENSLEYKNTIKKEYESTKFRLNIFRTVLFPRVLDFSTNKSLIDALTAFEKESYDYETIIQSLGEKTTKEIVDSLIALVSVANNVWSLIANDLKESY